MKALTAIILLAGLTATGQVPKGKLLWEENFDGQSLNEKAWNFELGDGCPHICGWGNNERQSYTKDNHVVKGGNLNITARKDGDKYTSTRITTAGKKEFQYGYIEARAKVPVGHGIWPAFWMLGDNIDTAGWPLCGEVDILESVGNNPNVNHSSLHSPGRSGNTPDTATTTVPNSATEFHVYAADWSAESIKFYVDDKLFYTYANSASTPFNQKFFLILNLAMGGNFGGTVDPNFTNATFEVDYVRVYN